MNTDPATNTTTATIAQTIGRCVPFQPEWGRIPDATMVSGIGRSSLYQLIEEGKIRSVCLRERGKVRGIRLINLRSLNDYISSFEGNEGEQDNETDKKNARRAGKHRRAKSAN